MTIGGATAQLHHGHPGVVTFRIARSRSERSASEMARQPDQPQKQELHRRANAPRDDRARNSGDKKAPEREAEAFDRILVAWPLSIRR